jgi:phage shock protein PspC (stress-responsive transcriptional regulator)
MKKNLRVNISGIIFNIDEDAHIALKNYLDRLRLHFGNGNSTDEIITDIESRMAEMFQQKANGSDLIIDLNMVNQAIKAMGEPGEIEGEETAEDESNYNPKDNYYSEAGKRRLYRDSDQKIVGGVSSGLANYFNIDPIWIRLAFVILTFSGMSILVYIILWIVIPEAKTTAQKLEMRGEPINIDNIEKSIKDELNDISNRMKDIKNRHFKKKSGELTIFEKIAHVIVRIIAGIFRFFAFGIGIFFAILSLILIVMLVPTFFSSSVFWLNHIPGFHLISLSGALALVMESPYDINLFLTALAMVLFVPLVALLYNGIKVIFNIRYRNHAIGIALSTIWITGLVLLIYTTTKLANAFDREAMVEEPINLSAFEGDTLRISLKNLNTLTEGLPIVKAQSDQYLFCSDEQYYYLNPTINTEILDSNAQFSISIRKQSRGETHLIAQQNAEEIQLPFQQNDSLITLSSYCYWPIKQQFRAQKVELIIGIPQGKTLLIDPQIMQNELENNFQTNADMLEKCESTKKNHQYIYIDKNRDHVIIHNKNRRIEILDDEIDLN